MGDSLLQHLQIVGVAGKQRLECTPRGTVRVFRSTYKEHMDPAKERARLWRNVPRHVAAEAQRPVTQRSNRVLGTVR